MLNPNDSPFLMINPQVRTQSGAGPFEPSRFFAWRRLACWQGIAKSIRMPGATAKNWERGHLKNPASEHLGHPHHPLFDDLSIVLYSTGPKKVEIVNSDLSLVPWDFTCLSSSGVAICV
jgi:hypothetical protein